MSSFEEEYMDVLQNIEMSTGQYPRQRIFIGEAFPVEFVYLVKGS